VKTHHNYKGWESTELDDIPKRSKRVPLTFLTSSPQNRKLVESKREHEKIVPKSHDEYDVIIVEREKCLSKMPIFSFPDEFRRK